ncbi:MAG: hypothetical protein ABSE49_30085 [Polyangiaceae bacterium]|jgi:hypothetical protein
MRPTTTMAVLMATLGLVACGKSSGGEASPAPAASATAAAASAPAAPNPAPAAGHRRICKNPPATGGNSLACHACVERECSATFNGMMSVCSGYFSCVEGCDCTDRSCLLGCVGKMDSACTSAPVTTAQGKCEKDHCAAECKGH